MTNMYITLGAIVILLAIHRIHTKHLNCRFRTRLSVLGVWSIGIFVWPYIWKYIVGEYTDREEGWIGLMWPIFFLAMEMLSIRRYDPYDHSSNRGILTMDANGICSLTFALSGILGAQRRANEYAHIFITAVVCCLAFVMPSPHTLSTISKEAIVLEAVQKVFLTYSTGLLLTGVMLMSSHSKYETAGNVQ